MKNLIFSLFCLVFSGTALMAQNHFYSWTLYGSIAPQQAPVIPDLFVNRNFPADEFRFNLNKVRSELSIGVRRNFRFSSPFFGTLGAEYAQKEETYSMLFTCPSDQRAKMDYVLNTTRKTITIPIGIGIRMGRLDITSGLKAQYTMSSGMQGEATMGMRMTKSQTDAGWYTGVGVNFDRVRIGMTYQSMLCRNGNYLIHDGSALELMRVPNNVSFNVGISF